MQKMTARAVGAYARVRYQFKMAVGRFGGRRGGAGPHRRQHLSDGRARVMTAGAIDLGEKPSVVSAIVKYHVTERARQTVNDGMDVIGGRASAWGRRTSSARAYQQIPVGDHRGGRQHPHPQPDFVRPGRDPLPPVCA